MSNGEVRPEAIARHVARHWLGFRDYEDILQEARIGVWQAQESYKPHRGATPLTWALSRARYRVRHYVSRVMPHTGPRRENGSPNPTVILYADPPTDSVSFPLDNILLNVTIDRLRETDRAAVRDWLNGRADAEHAAHVGLHPNTVGKHRRRGFARLRSLLYG